MAGKASEAEAERHRDIMTRLFGIVQAAVSLHLAAVLVFAEKKLVGRLFLGHVLAAICL